MFEDFIRNAIPERYNLIRFITAHDKQQPTHVNNANSGGGISIPNNTTTSALQSLGATFNFIDFCLKQFQHNYKVRLTMYHEDMIKLLYKYQL